MPNMPSAVATTWGRDAPIANIEPCPGGKIASNLSTPNMPKLDNVNVPVLYSSGCSFLTLALSTKDFQVRDKE